MKNITKKRIAELMVEHQNPDVVGYEMTYVDKEKKVQTVKLLMLGFNEDYWFIRDGLHDGVRYSWSGIVDLKLIHDEKYGEFIHETAKRMKEVKIR